MAAVWKRVDRQVRDDLARYLGGKPLILGWGRTVTDQWCVALPDRLCWGAGSQWQQLAWHLIEHGGWNSELGELRWTDLDGQPGSIRVATPGRLPEVFWDRVNATIIARQRMPITGTDDGIVVSGRRDLTDPDAPLQWRASAMRGTQLSDPEIAAQVADAVAAVRAEYDS